AKRVELFAHARLQFADGFLQRVDLLQVKLDEKAVIVAHVAAQGLDQLLARRFEAALRQLRELVRVSLTSHQRVKYCASALAQDVGDHRGELDVGVLERL